MRDADLSCTDLRGVNLYDADLSGTKLQHCLYDQKTKLPENFDPSNRGMYLIEAYSNLSNAHLNGADLSNANLSGADLNGANLYGANLNKTKLIKAKNLTVYQVKKALNWQKAKYDKSFYNLLKQSTDT